MDASLQDLEKIVQGKSSSLNAVEEGECLFCLLFGWLICADFFSVLRQKVLAGDAAPTSAAGGAG